MNQMPTEVSSISRGGYGDAIQEETLKPKLREGQACGCRVLVDSDGLPPRHSAYVAYAIYLYWTLPVAVRYSGAAIKV